MVAPQVGATGDGQGPGLGPLRRLSFQTDAQDKKCPEVSSQTLCHVSSLSEFTVRNAGTLKHT